MIRVFMNEEEPLPNMSIIELQGKLVLPEGLIPKTSEELEQKQEALRSANSGCSSSRNTNNSAGQTKEEEKKNHHHHHNTSMSRTTSDNRRERKYPAPTDSVDAKGNKEGHDDDDGDTLAWRRSSEIISIGFIDHDPHFPSRRTLRMGTTRVEGSAGTYRHPILVIKKRRPPQVVSSSSTAAAASSSSFPSTGGITTTTTTTEGLSSPADGDKGNCNGVDALYDQLIATALAHADKNSSMEHHQDVVEDQDHQCGEMKGEEDGIQRIRTAPLDHKNKEEDHNGDDEEDEESTVMFSDWIERHPEMLELETHFGGPNLFHKEEEDGPANANANGTIKKNKNKNKATPQGHRKRMRGEVDEEANDHSPASSSATNQTISALSPPPRELVAMPPNNSPLVQGGVHHRHHHHKNSSSWLPLEDWERRLLARDPTLEVKDYDMVGVIEDYTIFNTKPSRVFR